MILKNLIYIYQLEHYDKKRFLSFVYQNINWFYLNKRGKLSQTIRSVLLFYISILIVILIAVITYYVFDILWLFSVIILSVIFLPFIVIFVDTLIAPLVLFQKTKILKRAQGIIQENKNRGLITIGITGSFGKTSMKNVLNNILGEKYAVFQFPGNINTDIGVAQYIIKKNQEVKKADILISEMSAYKMGEIKKLSKLIQPTYSILTSIGECHLERFGSMENIITAKFELPNSTEKKAFLNACDSNVKKYADEKIIKNVDVVEICGNKMVENIKYLNDFNGTSFEYLGHIFTTKIIADYIIDFIMIAVKVAEELTLHISEIENGIKKIDFVPHRLEVIKNKKLNRTIIDDSYNGNYAGFLLGLKILSRADGRKVVLTPGIVELGEKRSKERHTILAEKYAENVDLVLLIKNKNTDFIESKFKELGFNKFKVYLTVKEAHDDLVNVLRNGDTIIFQNDISDNY
ncbi:MAG TPA: hypothetical protein ENI76_07500 [Ignavibacteria bacterium]|nr:hypothetical protein [Ignavibacteria bacterium]